MEIPVWREDGVGGRTGPEGDGTSRGLFCQILSLVSDSKAQHGASQIYTSKTAGADLRSHIEQAGALLGVSG